MLKNELFSEESNLKPVLKALVEEKGLRYINLNLVAVISQEKPKKDKDREIYAECSRCTSREKFFVNLKYVITVYPPFFELPEEHQKTVLWHELLHISKTFDGTMRKHDIEEFIEIVPYRFRKELEAFF